MNTNTSFFLESLPNLSASQCNEFLFPDNSETISFPSIMIADFYQLSYSFAAVPFYKYPLAFLTGFYTFNVNGNSATGKDLFKELDSQGIIFDIVGEWFTTFDIFLGCDGGEYRLSVSERNRLFDLGFSFRGVSVELKENSLVVFDSIFIDIPSLAPRSKIGSNFKALLSYRVANSMSFPL